MVIFVPAHSSIRFITRSLTLLILAVGAFASCKAVPPRNFLHAEWSEFAAVNPTDIVVMRVQGVAIPPEVNLADVREAAESQLRNHRYSTLDAGFVDSGNPLKPVAMNAGVTTTHGDAVGPKFGAVSRLQIVIKDFDFRRYEISRDMRVVGEFQFHEVGTDRLLATVNSDQVVDLQEETRLGLGTTDAMRAACRKFVEATLRAMPDRRVESQGTAQK